MGCAVEGDDKNWANVEHRQSHNNARYHEASEKMLEHEGARAVASFVQQGEAQRGNNNCDKRGPSKSQPLAQGDKQQRHQAQTKY